MQQHRCAMCGVKVDDHETVCQNCRSHMSWTAILFMGVTPLKTRVAESICALSLIAVVVAVGYAINICNAPTSLWLTIFGILAGGGVLLWALIYMLLRQSWSYTVAEQKRLEDNNRKPVLKFRQHRGSLDEAMKTVIQIPPTKTALYETVRSVWLEYDLPGLPHEGALTLSYIGYDPRCGWQTYLVLLDDVVVGYTDGPLD